MINILLGGLIINFIATILSVISVSLKFIEIANKIEHRLTSLEVTVKTFDKDINNLNLSLIKER